MSKRDTSSDETNGTAAIIEKLLSGQSFTHKSENFNKNRCMQFFLCYCFLLGFLDLWVSTRLSGLQQAARDITPVFIRTMPSAYFDDTTQEMRLAHVKAIIAAEASGMAQTVTLRDAKDHNFTFISNRSYPGQLGEFVKRLPHDRPLTSAKVYTSQHGDWVLDIFHFGEHQSHDPTDRAQSAKAKVVYRFVE